MVFLFFLSLQDRDILRRVESNL